ncbi:NAD-dependent epimerase/dehydratase family protein [Actinocrispum wychmicini]|uniref:Nucleoside-diphosphate-sugar epimerase n=1 Tax=Actinocrispum wychmicini TaxID=1213861 RepID=A0A4R2K567_9PSEU|nr:NAD-dependent epimerase/dehydratase family protein [Actinocrispum wychmicini]TCO64976.1 nucleoside-diphosphate-sugar epimerase [Actinocrispum wychmicini]
MRLLILGGTVFLGHAIAAEAVRRGHDVTCVARGSTNGAPAPLIRIDRDDPDGLAPLAGEHFDAVIDLAKMSYPHVRRAVETIRTDHWSFVSSISVYAEHVTGRVDDPVFEPVESANDPENYGAIKVASENAVRTVWGSDAFIVRAGLITGHGDVSDRFGYWPARLADTGQVVVPDALDQPAHYIDVADLATWILAGAEQRLGGTFNAAGLPTPLGSLLAEIASVAGGDGELVPVAPDKLVELGVQYWAGPKSLPLWPPPGHIIGANWDVRPAIDAGLRYRPAVDAIASALAYERSLGLDRPRNAGLTRTEEAEVLSLN